MAAEQRFPLAPMHGVILVLTYIMLPLPLVIGAVGRGQAISVAVAAFVAVIYAFIWFAMRPSAFVVSQEGLRTEFGVRKSLVPAAELEGAEELSGSEFRAAYGWGMRVGAGGLWGGFGLLVTRKGTLGLFVSRTDRFVLVHQKHGRTLLLTPSDPGRFVQAIESARAAAPGDRI